MDETDVKNYLGLLLHVHKVDKHGCDAIMVLKITFTDH